MKRFASLLAAFALACSAPAFAWGSKGHQIINQLAAREFPASMPAFLRTPQVAYELTFLGPELDELKDSGESWDADYDTGHYLDLLDDGTVSGAVRLADMPKNREAYDDALRAAGTDQYRQGYLPYAILDGWQQLRKDFAYWRVYNYQRNVRKRSIEEALIERDLGVWGHFVGDGSQPLHVTVHFNGWGRYPNPNGFTQSRRTHSMFESTFVNRYVSEARVARIVDPKPFAHGSQRLASQRTVMQSIARYLTATSRTVPTLYEIEKRGGFASGSPEAVAFTASRLAAGASELRDLSLWAWQDSLNETVGYPAMRVRDILAGRSSR